MDKKNTPPSGDYCWQEGHTGGWNCPECATPEPLTIAPFKLQQFHDEPRLQIVYNPLDSMGRTGAVLGLDEMEQLEALIRFIRNAPKVTQEG